jgi:hypothetical protein
LAKTGDITIDKALIANRPQTTLTITPTRAHRRRPAHDIAEAAHRSAAE